MSREPVRRPEIVVDLGAIRRNVGRLRDVVAPDGSDVMVVVKADGYGHGMLEAAYAARQAGAPWLGVATLDEAVRLREAGDTGRILSWLTVPGDDWAAAIDRDVDVTAYTVPELAEIRAAVTGTPARVQLKIDTGLSRGGSTAEHWPERARRRPGRRGRRRLDGRPASGRTSRRQTSLTTRPTTSRSAPSATRSRRGRACRPAPRGPPPRQLRRRPPAAEQPVRPGPLRHRLLRPRPSARPQPRSRPGAGDDASRRRSR